MERLLKLFNLKREELVPALLSVLVFATLFTAYGMLRPVREVMGITAGVDNLQWLFTGTFIATLLIQLPLGFVAARVRPCHLPTIVYGFFALNLLLFALAVKYEIAPVATAMTFYIWLSTFNLCAVSLGWSVLNDLFDHEEARHIFALAAAGCSIGSVLGPGIISLSAGALTTVDLLVAAAVLLGLCLLLTALLRAHLKRRTDKDRGMERAGPFRGSAWQGFAKLVKSPYLLGISLFIIVNSWLSTFLYFEFMDLMAETYPDHETQLQIFAGIDFGVNAVTLIIQLFLAGRIADRFGLWVLLAVVPFLLGLGFAVLIFAPVCLIAIAVTILRRIGEYGFIRPGREMLFTVVSRDDKYLAKNLINSGVYRGGDMTSAWISHLAQNAGGNSLLAATGLGFSLVCALTGLALARAAARRAAPAIKEEE